MVAKETDTVDDQELEAVRSELADVLDESLRRLQTWQELQQMGERASLGTSFRLRQDLFMNTFASCIGVVNSYLKAMNGLPMHYIDPQNGETLTGHFTEIAGVDIEHATWKLAFVHPKYPKGTLATLPHNALLELFRIQ